MSDSEHDDVVLRSLKFRYFEQIKKEDIGKTPQITKELDNLEEAIRKLQSGELLVEQPS